MPVEIREIYVRATVPSKSGPKGPQDEMEQSGVNGPDTERIVSECVAAVMRILEKRDRR